MVGFESESKFTIFKNPKSFQDDVVASISTLGYESSQLKVTDQVDVYLDCQMKIYKAGYSLRNRYRQSSLHMITLKTLERLDEAGNVRIEEEARTLKDLVKKLTGKLTSIYQDPVDEDVINLIKTPEVLSPVLILTNHREMLEIKLGKQKCEVAFDTYAYLFPTASAPVYELEIEGSKEFDTIRDYIYKKYGHGRWQTIGLTTMSKFENGLRLGGMI